MTIIDRVLGSIAAHTGAGPFAELDDIDPCPDDFEPVPLVLRVADFTDDDLAAMLAPESVGRSFDPLTDEPAMHDAGSVDDIYITCPQCGRRVSIYNHLCDMGSGGTSSIGCAFGGGKSDAQQLEFDEIPLHDAVETCHRIAEKMRMYE